ncbi:MAG: 4,5-dihydroxyphthalate dehydrogenase [Rhodospirillaceae bacterium]|nr:4,5-dihydroxyphthalate dehydrogenase [Rhodospirillaceae bacterium]OUT80262.1 MAG: hypothetical protein CBB83_01665 [Rhodospirillaceae bacterium TMED23]|tara:strand:- start:15111 stop:16316 length:1206 start_codon:yes stop_codon:yes gene_type:complete
MKIKTSKVYGLGVIGMGRAFTVMLPTFIKDPRIELMAGIDKRLEARVQFQNDFGGIVSDNMDSILDNPKIEIIYLATPAELHINQIKKIVSADKHILLEKPMSLTIKDALAITKLIAASKSQLIVGHSHSFNLPIQLTHELINSQKFGPLRMMSALNYTDFMYRPRRPDELITKKGGGVVYSQAAHQIDILRLLGGGTIKSIRANTGIWDTKRNTEGAYNAILTFNNGVTAIATYSGYAHFDSDEFQDWHSEFGQPQKNTSHMNARKNLNVNTREINEGAFKASKNYGGINYSPLLKSNSSIQQHQHFGSIIASCENGDLRPVPSGVLVYSDEKHYKRVLKAPKIPRVEVIDELIGTIENKKDPIHTCSWALANLEACLGILESSKKQKEVFLKYQCELGE